MSLKTGTVVLATDEDKRIRHGKPVERSYGRTKQGGDWLQTLNSSIESYGFDDLKLVP
jgi:hypothetical protein